MSQELGGPLIREVSEPDHATRVTTSTTPPSSPPMEAFEPTENTRSARKRSHEDMRESDTVIPSSATVMGDDQSSAPQNEPAPSHSNPSATPREDEVELDEAPTSSSQMPPPVQKPPISAQAQGRVRKNAGVRASGLQAKSSAGKPSAVDELFHSSPEAEVEDGEKSPADDPEEQIVKFDWEDLHIRYHQKLRDFQAREQAIFGDFNSLIEYFGIWAGAIDAHEDGRSFKRLKTQTAYVKHKEDELEARRLHYSKVVDAFKSALDLLST